MTQEWKEPDFVLRAANDTPTMKRLMNAYESLVDAVGWSEWARYNLDPTHREEFGEATEAWLKDAKLKGDVDLDVIARSIETLATGVRGDCEAIQTLTQDELQDMFAS